MVKTDATAPLPTAETIAAKAAANIFGRPLIMNVYRSVIVEAILATVLPATWRWCAEDWNAFDFVHEDGTRLELKQTAARQSWTSPAITAARRFDIAARRGRYEGTTWLAGAGRNADLYVFAYHATSSEDADHRDPAQWLFYVVEETRLPLSKSIGLRAVIALSVACNVLELGDAIDGARERFQASRQ